jgi:hypothetical protein
MLSYLQVQDMEHRQGGLQEAEAEPVHPLLIAEELAAAEVVI